MSKIVVIGSSNTDMIVRSERIPCAGETILGGQFHTAAGGKGANQAVACAQAGGDVTFIARVGNDIFGNQALAGFREQGLDVTHVKQDDQTPSGVALIMVDAQGQNSIAVASGANLNVSVADVQAVADVIEEAALVLMQLEIPLETVEAVAQIASRAQVPVILNPAPAQPLSDTLLEQVTILTPNETESQMLTGCEVRTESQAAAAAHKLKTKGPKTVIITLGELGAYVVSDTIDQLVPTFTVEPMDTTAAGDTFNGALAAALAEGQPLCKAVTFAHAAAALSVTKLGAQPSVPNRVAIEAFFTRQFTIILRHKEFVMTMKKLLSVCVVLCLGVIAMQAVASASQPIPVIYDSDIGDDIDDTWALGLLLQSPELDLKLVVGDQGKPLYRAKLFAKFLESTGHGDVPVGLGLGNREDQGGPQAAWVEGYDLKQYPGEVLEDGVQAIIDLIMSSEETVTLLCVGPVPNIAEALRREPAIANKARFVGMHGSVRLGYGGSQDIHAEYNVKADAPACQAVFKASWPMTITPLDTCGLVDLKGERYATVKHSLHPVARAIIENYRIWSRDKNDVSDTRSSTLFDTVAVYLAFCQQLCHMEQLGIRVDNQGFTRIDDNAKHMSVATAWKDMDAFKDFLVHRVTGTYEQTQPARRIRVSEYVDKMKAGWIGQMAGVGWGAPTEFRWLGKIIPASDMPEWKPDMINQFNQDDIYVEMTFVKTLEEYGLDCSIRQAGIDFANSGYRTMACQ